MAFTSKQLKAIQWYLDNHPGSKLQLSTPPNVYFKTPVNKIVSVHITGLSKQYDSWNEEDKKQRARDRAQEAHTKKTP